MHFTNRPIYIAVCGDFFRSTAEGLMRRVKLIWFVARNNCCINAISQDLQNAKFQILCLIHNWKSCLFCVSNRHLNHAT